jgi:hypothetical protein
VSCGRASRRGLGTTAEATHRAVGRKRGWGGGKLAGTSVGSRGRLFAVLEGAQQDELQPALQKCAGVIGARKNQGVALQPRVQKNLRSALRP